MNAQKVWNKQRALQDMKIIPIEFSGQRVLLTEQLARVYKTDVNNIQANFKRNQRHFEEGKHYFKLEGLDLKEFKNQPTINQLVSRHTSQLYLWTERGANRHCKILDTDKAWEQFDNLEDTYFKVKNNKVLSPTEILKVQLQVMEEQEKKIKSVENKVINLEDNMPLFNIECKELQARVKKVGVKILGGKSTLAYKDNSIRQKVYTDIQHQLKREFGVTRYEAIKRCQFGTAIKIVEEYKVPLILQQEIEYLNSQISL